MNLESEHAIAIKRFLDAIDYKAWEEKASEVAANVPWGVDKETQLGTYYFRKLADSIGYLDSFPSEEKELCDGLHCADGLRCVTKEVTTKCLWQKSRG